MPEAAVDKNDGVISGQHKVRFTRQLPDMKPVPETLPVKGATDNYFRSGIGALYP